MFRPALRIRRTGDGLILSARERSRDTYERNRGLMKYVSFVGIMRFAAPERVNLFSSPCFVRDRKPYELRPVGYTACSERDDTVDLEVFDVGKDINDLGDGRMWTDANADSDDEAV
ncbi:hypothetical protein NW754_015113 [Fusarium falciforme]|nr:hypothetical protein NW754_015113 [Fusarium falciforme]